MVCVILVEWFRMCVLICGYIGGGEFLMYMSMFDFVCCLIKVCDLKWVVVMVVLFVCSGVKLNMILVFSVVFVGGVGFVLVFMLCVLLGVVVGLFVVVVVGI